jgi:hypothetical protein
MEQEFELSKSASNASPALTSTCSKPFEIRYFSISHELALPLSK